MNNYTKNRREGIKEPGDVQKSQSIFRSSYYYIKLGLLRVISRRRIFTTRRNSAIMNQILKNYQSSLIGHSTMYIVPFTEQSIPTYWYKQFCFLFEYE